MDAFVLLAGSIVVLALLGIVIAFSPTLIITEIAILTRSKDPIVQTLMLVAGIAASVTLFSLIAIVLIDPAKEINVPTTRQVFSTIPITDICIGALLAFAGIRMLRPSSAPQAPTNHQREFTMSPKAVFTFGFIKMSTSLSSIAAIIFASRYIKTYYAGEPIQVAALVWVVAISVLPFALLIAAKLYRPQLFGKIQNASDRVNQLDWRRLLAGALLLASIWFLLIGIRHL